MRAASLISAVAGSTASGPSALAPAVRAAIAGLGDDRAALVLAFSSGAGDPDAGELAACEAATGAPVVGMTGSGAIGLDGPFDDGCSAIAFADGFETGVGMAQHASRDPRGAAAAATGEALAALDPGYPHRMLLLLLDARSGDQSEAIAGAYGVAGPHVPLAGGGAGGERARLLCGGVHEDATVAIALASCEPIGIGVANGCRPHGVPSIVTGASGGTLQRFDGASAKSVYLQQIGCEGIGDDEFAAVAALHPLAQAELSGAPRLRHVFGADPDGSLRCAASVPTNAVVEFTAQTPATIVRSAAHAVGDALAQLEGRPASGVIVFDCAGRRHALETEPDGLAAEVAALVDALGTPAPALAGLYTRGEVARVRGAKGDQNHAVVVVAFA